MFLAWRDLRRTWRRFLLVGLVVVLVAVLSTVLAGLADGLVRDGTSGLRALPYTHLALEPGSAGGVQPVDRERERARPPGDRCRARRRRRSAFRS